MSDKDIKFYNRVLEFREHMLNSLSLTDFYKNYPSDQNWYYRQKGNRKNGSMTLEELKIMDGNLPGWYELSEEMFDNARTFGIMHLSRNEGLKSLEELMNVVGAGNAWILHIFGFSSIEVVANIPANLNQAAIENPMYGQLSRKLHVELHRGEHYVRDALVNSQRLINEKLYPGINLESIMYYWVYLNGDKVCDIVTTHAHMFNFNSLSWYDIESRRTVMANQTVIEEVIKQCNDEYYDLISRSSFVFRRLYDCFMQPDRFDEIKTHEEWNSFHKRLAEHYRKNSLTNQYGSVIINKSDINHTKKKESNKPKRKGLFGLFDMFDRK